MEKLGNQKMEEMGKQKGSFLSLSKKVTEFVVHPEKLGVEVDKPEKHQTQEKGEQIGSFAVIELERRFSPGKKRGRNYFRGQSKKWKSRMV